MKPKLRIIVVNACLSFILVCANCGAMSPDPPEKTKRLEVIGFCDLLESPLAYDGKRIIVRAGMRRLGGRLYLSDAGCPTKHPLVDVEFEQDTMRTICDSGNKSDQQICMLAKKETQKLYNVKAVFEGDFTIYQTSTGFSKNGLRFRFSVVEIKETISIEQIETERVV